MSYLYVCRFEADTSTVQKQELGIKEIEKKMFVSFCAICRMLIILFPKNNTNLLHRFNVPHFSFKSNSAIFLLYEKPIGSSAWSDISKKTYSGV